MLTFLANARTGTQILSRKAVEAAGDDFGKKPVGTGAYMLKDWRAGRTRDAGGIRRLLRRRAQDRDHRYAADRRGVERRHCAAWRPDRPHLDGALRRYPDLQQNAAITVLKQPGLNCRFVSLNHRKRAVR